MVRETLGARNAVVVAHPDDESLWCGGLIAAHPDLDWTVIACSLPVDDRLREGKFYKACEALGAHGMLIRPVPDRGVKIPLECLDEAVGATWLISFDAVVTHGPLGEYGHPHHQQVNQAVRRWFPGPILTFGWHKAGEGAHRLNLEMPAVEAKRKALKCYDHIFDSLWNAYIVRDRVPFNYETYDVV